MALGILFNFLTVDFPNKDTVAIWSREYRMGLNDPLLPGRTKGYVFGANARWASAARISACLLRVIG